MIHKFIIILLFSIVPMTGCAEKEDVESENKSKSIAKTKKEISTFNSLTNDAPHQTQLLDSADSFVSSKNAQGNVVASYFSTQPIEEKARFNRIVWILKSTGAKQSFITLVEARLPTNRRLKKDNFILPLTDEEGKKYQFEYISKFNKGLFILNYQEK
ncbi:hypothetical protein [Aliikangiella sp. IMCC44359]|uniref:hypothetical protein n=1 Tax=Aliikangiella sp. IMCC44359 TaxID=3459125 RepID=UPI00403AAAE1